MGLKPRPPAAADRTTASKQPAAAKVIPDRRKPYAGTDARTQREEDEQRWRAAHRETLDRLQKASDDLSSAAEASAHTAALVGSARRRIDRANKGAQPAKESITIPRRRRGDRSGGT